MEVTKVNTKEGPQKHTNDTKRNLFKYMNYMQFIM